MERTLELRKRRRKHRTLDRLEAKERVFDQQRLKDVKEATDAAEKRLRVRKASNTGFMLRMSPWLWVGGLPQ